MKGKQIYFTQQEMQALLNTLQDWQDLLGVKGENEYVHRLKNGLGTAWGKLQEGVTKKKIN